MPNINLDFIQNLDVHSTQAKFLIIVLFIITASFVINYLLSHSILGGSYRIFVAPGIILHELSHAIFCLLTGAKITKVAFFNKDGGEVQHSAPKIPILGQLLISLSPFAFGILAIFFLSKRLGIHGVDITTVSISKEGISAYFNSTISNLELKSKETWLIVYLVLSIAVTMTPSTQDLRNIMLSIFGILLTLVILYKFTSLGNQVSLLIPGQLLVLLPSVSFLLILGLFLSIILYIISKIVKPV